MKQNDSIILADQIDQSIMIVRGQKIMLDSDLAALYSVELRVIQEASLAKGSG